MDMALLFTRKEDLRLQILDLQQKLEESEEERKNLEKTCSLLIRAYKEEERMRYKALNNKYEKFLEDCQCRRRRNDIILKSLCRIEDRARVLFTRTERLRFLKDRYIYYMKLYDASGDEEAISPEKATAASTPLKSSTGDKYISKSVHWKTPQVVDETTDHKVKEPININETPSVQIDINDKASSENYYKTLYEFYSEKYKTPTLGSSFIDDLGASSRSLSVDYPADKTHSEKVAKKLGNEDNWKMKDDILKGSKNHKELSPHQADKKGMNEFAVKAIGNIQHGNQLGTSGNDKRFESNKNVAMLSDTGKSGLINLEEKDLNKVRESREKFDLKHQESIEKLKSVLLSEESENRRQFDKTDDKSQRIIEKDEIENNEKGTKNTQKSVVSTVLNSSYTYATKPTTDSQNTVSYKDPGFVIKEVSNEQKLYGDIAEEESTGKDEHSLPKGLDGVDYDNETYPESYYEQPVHPQNYSSIASNVILEEDENEPDIEQPETSNVQNFTLPNSQEHLTDKTRQSPGHLNSNFNQPNVNQGGSLKGERFQESNSDRSGSSPQITPKYDLSKGSDSEKSFKSDKQGPERSVDATLLDKSQVGQNLKPTSGGQSTIAHLLESDSESFQIEHGDRPSGNEDSDFDFSFGQN